MCPPSSRSPQQHQRAPQHVPLSPSTEEATTATNTQQQTQQMQPQTTTTPRQKYNPERVYTEEALEGLNLLEHPVWIFDIDQRCIGWANHAAVALWNAATLTELLARNFSQDMSEASVLRLQGYQDRFRQGQTLEDVWTFYPQGQAKTCRIVASGIRTLCHAQQPNPSMLVEGMVVIDDTGCSSDADKALLRGVEMLRHLPMPVCQFDMEGQCMYQNPEAMLPSNSTGGSNSVGTAAGGSAAAAKASPATKQQTDDADSSSSSSSTENKAAAKKPQTKGDADGNTTTTTATDAGSSFLERFVDPQVGMKALRDMQQLQQSEDNAAANATTPVTANTAAGDNGDTTEQIQSTTNTTTTTTTTTTASTKRTTTLQVELMHTRNGPRRCEVQLVQSQDPVTAQRVVLMSCRDLTDHLEAIRERESNHNKSEFIAILAHEIRTPLHQVTGFIDLLAQSPLNEEQTSFVATLQSSASGLMTVISDVLDYSKLDAGQMQLETIPFPPELVVARTLESVQAVCDEKQIHLELQKHDTTSRSDDGSNTTSTNTSTPLTIMGDPNRLRQVLLNFLSNAIKFTPQGGTVSVRVYPERIQRQRKTTIMKRDSLTFTSTHSNTSHDSDGIAPSNNNNNNNHDDDDKENTDSGHHTPDDKTTQSETETTMMDYLTFEVQDTGVGIAPEHQNIIFQQYQQANVAVARNFGGTGLGLTICKLILDNMEGDIGVKSQPGVGSTFWFRIPMVLPPTAPTPTEIPNEGSSTGSSTEGAKASTKAANTTTDGPQSSASSPPPPPPPATTAPLEQKAHLRILVAEDNKVNQKLINSMLKRLGHVATICENGKEAVEMICGSLDGSMESDAAQAFDAILMDVQMPVMGGLEATQRLRNQGCTIPILGLTASVVRCDFVDLGFSDWIPKPTRMNVLKERLETCVSQASNSSRTGAAAVASAVAA